MSTIRRVLGGALLHVPHPYPAPAQAPVRDAGPDGCGAPGTSAAADAARANPVAVTVVSGAALFLNAVRYVTAAMAVSAGTLVFLARGTDRPTGVLTEAGVAGPGAVGADRLLSGAALPSGQPVGPAVREVLHRATAAGLADGFAFVMFWLGLLAPAAIPLWLVLMPPSRSTATTGP
ncbi:hypothetical protein NJL88_16360 [Streptomyces sp. DK15]|uniref:hypothetical protein n=1 Tax=Streptomyces sp. DK15 TaxID=2957499 RepID=UPI0029BBEE1B|nr:hypothetical protein [Streptomyces sp. DK15]MDX2391592.1 hypothetical protein [Streptomyces sp. DK15]